MENEYYAFAEQVLHRDGVYGVLFDAVPATMIHNFWENDNTHKQVMEAEEELRSSLFWMDIPDEGFIISEGRWYFLSNSTPQTDAIIFSDKGVKEETGLRWPGFVRQPEG